jgi:hypothetical protein
MRHTAFDLRIGLERLTIKALQQQTFTTRHSTEVIPLLLWVVTNSRGPATVAIGITVLDGDNIVVLDRGRGCDGQRKRLKRVLVQWSPDIDETIAMLEKFVCFIREVPAYSLSHGRRGLVDMYTSHRCTRRVRFLTPDSMIKEEDAVRAWDIIEEKLFKLWVVVCFDGVVVDKVGLTGGRHILDDLEGVTV